MRPRALLLVLLLVGVLAAVVALRPDGTSPPPPAQESGRSDPTRLTLGLTRPLRVETLVEGLDTPWDLAWGPDQRIWVSERGGRISRVDPSTGSLQLAGELEVLEISESGLMGLAFHPDFEAEPWVYAAHTYGTRGRMRNQLVRMWFDGERLGEPDILLNEIPGQRNHDGSRLAVGPDGFLYMTTGDAGEGERAHDLGSLAGKILRLTLEGDPAPGNPFGSAVFSFGHRNPQGLAFHPVTELLYSAEHGPGANDEVNLIVAGGDFGWPEVRGMCDESPRSEAPYCRDHEVIEPLESWTPTVGIAGLAVYRGDLIPEWRGNLLVVSLRGGGLYRLTLSPDGRQIVDQETIIRGQYGRLRDVLVGPEGEIYLATSNRDGRGRPAANDDRILRLTPEP